MSYNSCVGRASREWFDFLYNKGTREVIYWKTREEDFKAIESGVKMFLYDTEKEEIYESNVRVTVPGTHLYTYW